MIIVDSSTALLWLIPDERSPSAETLLMEEIAAPDIIFVEVANVLGKKVRANELSLGQANIALDLLGESVSRVEATRPLLRSALDLSAALVHPVYDCVFLACALALDTKLATHDDRFRERAERGGYASCFRETTR